MSQLNLKPFSLTQNGNGMMSLYNKSTTVAGASSFEYQLDHAHTRLPAQPSAEKMKNTIPSPPPPPPPPTTKSKAETEKQTNQANIELNKAKSGPIIFPKFEGKAISSNN